MRPRATWTSWLGLPSPRIRLLAPVLATTHLARALSSMLAADALRCGCINTLRAAMRR